MKKKLHPFRSLITTTGNVLRGIVRFPNDYNGTKLKMQDGTEFEVFRHVIIGKRDEIPKDAALFIVRFMLDKMSVAKNKRFSRFPIPMFIGLPGFRAKFWMCNEETGFNQGIYQWATYQDAKNYSESFAVAFMTGRSKPGSVSFEILKNKNIYNLYEEYKMNSCGLYCI